MASSTRILVDRNHTKDRGTITAANLHSFVATVPVQLIVYSKPFPGKAHSAQQRIQEWQACSYQISGFQKT